MRRDVGFKTGEVGGETTATVFPTLACRRVIIKACAANTGNVYIGLSGVTKKDGTSDVTTGFELDAGQELELFPESGNMSEYYFICDGTGDDMTYAAFEGQIAN